MDSGRGGARANAGRKPKKGPTKARTVRLKAANADWLKQQADKMDVGQGDIVDVAIETLQEHPEKLNQLQKEGPQ